MSVFSIEKPENQLPVVFDSPHSGTDYPDDFGYACDFNILKTAEDQHVEELFENAPAYGISFLHAHFPRSYIDPNRAADDIDPQLLNEEWSGPHSINPSPRSHAGIGLIRRLVKPGLPVYDRALTSEEIVQRIEKYYRPYHSALEELMQDAHYNFGQVWHINCHSMPTASAYPKRSIGLIGTRPKPVDFVLGDRDGTTCDREFTSALRHFIRGLGYSVSTNDPFKGVELVDKFSAPTKGYHSLQLEINKSLYMSEKTGKKLGHFDEFKKHIDQISAFCADFVESRLVDLAAD